MSDLLARLIAAGTPADLVSEVAMEIARAQVAQEVVEKRRQSDRERQRAHRQRNVTSRDITDVTKASPLPKTPQTPQTPTPLCEEISPRARKAGFVLPDRIPAGPWAGFEEMRRKIKKPLTDHARHLAVAELDRLAADGWPPGDVLNHCTMNSYQGIYPPKGPQHGRQQQSDHPGGKTLSAADRLIASLPASERINRGAGAS